MQIERLYTHFLDSKGVSTDSRKLQADQIFFALKGPNFDGNKYAKQAIENGAKLAVIDESALADELGRFFLVSDVLVALQELASYHRLELGTKILALTGSNGKTTTKELMAAVLNQKFNVLFTKGNLNNHIGVPLTLLELSEQHNFAIIEMGANHIGEIASLCEIAKPELGFITNIGKAHLEGFGGLEGVVQGKTELYQFLKLNRGIIMIDEDNETLVKQLDNYENVIRYRSSEYTVVENESAYVSVLNSDLRFDTQLIGQYNSANLAAAIALGKYFEIEGEQIKEAIEAYKPALNRSQKETKGGHLFILDAYNANPSSMQVSLEDFANSSHENKILVMGEMLELGDYSSSEHEAVIEMASKLNFHQVWLVGKSFTGHKISTNFKWFEDVDLLIDWYNTIESDKRFSFLLKGSRGNQLEKFYQQIKT